MTALRPPSEQSKVDWAKSRNTRTNPAIGQARNVKRAGRDRNKRLRVQDFRTCH